MEVLFGRVPVGGLVVDPVARAVREMRPGMVVGRFVRMDVPQGHVDRPDGIVRVRFVPSLVRVRYRHGGERQPAYGEYHQESGEEPPHGGKRR